MIEISLYTALALYGGLLVFGAVGIYLYTEVKSQRVHKVLESQNLWRCSICGYTYLDEKADLFSTCPRCNSINRIDDAGVKPYAVELAQDADVREPGRRNTSRAKSHGGRARGPRRRR